MVNIAIVGPGLVGAELISQLRAYNQLAHSAKLPVIAISNSKKMLLTTPAKCATALTGDWTVAPDVVAADLTRVAQHAVQHQPCVIVDCTSSDSVAALYPSWLKLGLHVVTPNKKGFSGSLSLFKEIKALTAPKAGHRYPLAYHEATVGAGLPIISTLTDLISTGDHIEKIEGIFSGTLSYIFNNFSTTGDASTPKFSEIVAIAKAKGYTEPDPRDDLNGMDVARKVVILGRVAGQELSLESLEVENIVPPELRSISTSEEFMEKLPLFDDHFAALNQSARESGSVLRLVGTVIPGGQSSVKLVRYDASHPFASLKGSDNIIAFTTKRFPSPLIVQGSGAGAAVTAHGIFSDILRINAITSYAL
ncbi:homoserine dehydrogenase-domain-containing protein [Polychytrium aggregatum]|uniref:homoserine dehydrogenase-domain-containing protein n=1 Tax=Polychytrium aggregatum TaxID=110093 RepID=UPI0022FEC5BC|nr:homoserine dehydrogenase-domain-containing protein [Polychytrium aggregatum]KAI9204535.1 homoserine dehydrogenase-domain-containing protein [Polychytrium aggregatum]